MVLIHYNCFEPECRIGYETELRQPVHRLKWFLLETQAGSSASRGNREIRAGQMAWKALISS